MRRRRKRIAASPTGPMAAPSRSARRRCSSPARCSRAPATTSTRWRCTARRRGGSPAASSVAARRTRRGGSRKAEPRGRSSYPWLRLGAYAGVRARPVSLGPLLLYALVSAYLLFLLYRLTRLAQAWNRTGQIRQSAYPRKIPDVMASAVARCQAAIGLRSVSILGSSQISGPLTLGIRRAAIVLPESMLQSTSPQELTAALCHEMAHIRRHDFLMNLVYELALLPLSFHPAARLIKRRIDETRELACDEMAAGRIAERIPRRPTEGAGSG